MGSDSFIMQFEEEKNTIFQKILRTFPILI